MSDDDEGPWWQEWADEIADDGYVIDDDGNVIDTETGEIIGNVDDVDELDELFGSYWDDVADLNDNYG